MDLIDDAIVARTHAPFTGASDEFLCPWRPGLLGEQLDCCSKAEIRLHFIPGDRVGGGQPLGPSGCGCPHIGKVFSVCKESVEHVGVDDRRDTLPATGQEGRLTVDADFVDNISKARPCLGLPIRVPATVRAQLLRTVRDEGLRRPAANAGRQNP